MKIGEQLNIIELLELNSPFKIVLRGEDIMLVNDDKSVIIVLATDDGGDVILKEFTVQLSNGKVIIQYSYSSETGHFSTIAVDGIPIVGHMQGGAPITFGTQGLIDFLRDVSAGAIPAPIAGFLFPPLMPQ